MEDVQQAWPLVYIKTYYRGANSLILMDGQTRLFLWERFVGISTDGISDDPGSVFFRGTHCLPLFRVRLIWQASGSGNSPLWPPVRGLWFVEHTIFRFSCDNEQFFHWFHRRLSCGDGPFPTHGWCFPRSDRRFLSVDGRFLYRGLVFP